MKVIITIYLHSILTSIISLVYILNQELIQIFFKKSLGKYWNSLEENTIKRSCTRHHSKGFVCNSSFNHHSNPMKKVLLSPSLTDEKTENEIN